MLRGWMCALLATCAWMPAVSAIAQGGAAPAHRGYPLPDRGFLVLPVPEGWKEQVRRRDAMTPPTIHYQPESGPDFAVLVTAIGPMKEGIARPTPAEIKRNVQSAVEGVRSRSVEKSIAVAELKGPTAHGYYFKATDRTPKRGEFKYLAQGMLGVGELRVTFTVLTNDGQRAVTDTALGMLRNARHVPPQAAQPGTPGGSIPGVPDQARLRGLLEAGNYGQLDAELSTYQDAYRRGAIGDEETAKAFIVLQRSDPDLRPAYDKWVAEKPGSYVARLARGYYLMNLGYLARGGAYRAKTSKAQFADMHGLFKVAQEDLEASLKLDSKPVLSYGTLIAIAQGQGRREDAASYVINAIALDPYVYTARAAYLASLRPEWGGSLEQMELALATWKRTLDEAQIIRLGRMLEDAKWRAALEPAQRLVDRKQYREAIAEYSKALAQEPNARAFAMRGYCHAQLKEHGKAIEDFSSALELDPDGECCAGTRSNRARSYLVSGTVDKALADLHIAARNDDAWAMRELAMMYAFGRHGTKKDYKAARQWCEGSAKQGDALSMYCMGSLLHAGLGVPKDAARAAKWFEGAAQRGVADAQADLAYMLWNGQGVAQDRDRAILWWRAAAKQGNARAQGQLKSQLTTWEYFRKVTLAEWREMIEQWRTGSGG